MIASVHLKCKVIALECHRSRGYIKSHHRSQEVYRSFVGHTSAKCWHSLKAPIIPPSQIGLRQPPPWPRDPPDTKNNKGCKCQELPQGHCPLVLSGAEHLTLAQRKLPYNDPPNEESNNLTWCSKLKQPCSFSCCSPLFSSSPRARSSSLTRRRTMTDTR